MNKKVVNYFMLISLISVKCNAMERSCIKDTQNFPKDDISALTVENDRGAIFVTGWDQDYFHVKTRKKSSHEDSLRYLKSTISREGDTLKVRGIVEQHTDTQTFSGGNVVRQVGFGGGSIRMTGIEGNVHVGGGANVCIEQSLVSYGGRRRGNVSLFDGATVTQTTTTNSGSIDYIIFAPFIALKILLKTHYGDVSVKARDMLNSWNVTVRTHNGKIKARGLESIDAENAYGSIKAKAILDKVFACNNHGEITIKDANKVEAQTSYADLHVHQRDNADGNVDARNNHGTITIGNLANRLCAIAVNGNIYYSKNPKNYWGVKDDEVVGDKVIAL